MTDAMTGPLHGVRVLDLSSVIMGPYATQILGDLGAEVISVDGPDGDTNRIMGLGPARHLSGIALNLLRNKRNICLDLKSEGGRDAVLRIAASCDVVVTNLRPAPLARLRLTYDDIRAVRPDVVMCRAQGWPADTADGDKPAYDDVIQAATGVCHAIELRGGVPEMVPTLLADKVSGMTIAYAVLAALFHRERTGEGQLVEVPMVDAISAFMLVEHGASAIAVPPLGPAGYARILAEHRRPYRTLDGWLAVLPYSASNFDDLFREGGREDLVGDARVQTAASRNRHAGELYAVVGEVVATRTTAFWLDYCARHDIPAGPVRTLDELIEELPVVTHPHAGPHRLIPPPTRFSATPATVRRHAPLIGEQGREILREVGLSDGEIDALAASGALLHADDGPAPPGIEPD